MRDARIYPEGSKTASEPVDYYCGGPDAAAEDGTAVDCTAEDGTAVDCTAEDGTAGDGTAELSKKGGRYGGIT